MTFADGVDAPTNVCPTTTPNSSVKSRLGSINAQEPNCPPFMEKLAITSLSGGNTTAVNNNPLTSGVCFCWCNCNVDRPSAHNWPVCRSSWCGMHDCRASVPNNPSDPILATTQHILHCSPGKTTFKLIHPYRGQWPGFSFQATGPGNLSNCQESRSGYDRATGSGYGRPTVFLISSEE